MEKAQEYIKHFNMTEHPEGGHFVETYRSSLVNNDRNLSTAIYFLLVGEDISHFHKIKSDEIWHHYDGGPLRLLEIDLEGQIKETIIGKNISQGNRPQYTVPAGYWFASTPLHKEDYCFVGCTVSPGFDFEDFTLAEFKSSCEIYGEEKLAPLKKFFIS